MAPDTRDDEQTQTMTLEAFADTIVPGEKRCPHDRAIAGACPGGGAVAAGAVTLLRDPAGGIAAGLDALVDALNEHAEEYAREQNLGLDNAVPPFVALPFAHRTALVQRLVAPDHPEKEMWVGLVIFSNMAFDAGAHLPTAEAVAAGHPGLRWMGFAEPQADGLWRFPDFSYRRELASPHPNTTPSGSPA